ncbi:MAG: flagellar hook protein FlgE [Sulfurimonas sp.]|jgi:flagellar hook protein FlgE|uniref:flagellar basal body rod C-terminal domain-containing protein n=1 Tax=Sulfurimonas sp. TaxID=2022749 RepID=UPI0039E6B923
MNISGNISSIGSHQTLLNTNANNVANVNTDGFRPSDTKVTSNGEGTTTNTRLSDDTGSAKSQTDLAKELTDQIIAEDAVAVNVSAIKTQDEMIGSLLDIKA